MTLKLPLAVLAGGQQPLIKLRYLCRAGVAGGLLMLSACAQQAVKPESQQVPPEEEAPLPTRAFETETLYSLMVAELAGSRNRLDIMLNNYVKEAIDTQDAGITERAAQLAHYLQNRDATLKMATQWASLAPGNAQARYMAMAAQADAGRYFQAFENGKFLLNENQLPHGLDALAVKASASGASEADTATLLKLYQQLAAQYPSDAELTLALSFLHYHSKQLDSSLEIARQAQALKPEYEQAHVQELRILEQTDPTQAKIKLAETLELFPDNQRLRLQYARELTRNNLPAAAEQFAILLEQTPGDPQIELALALTYYQQAELDLAKQHFSPLINTPRQGDTANYYLGQIAKQQNQPEQAISHFSAVKPSKEFLPAMARATQLLHQHDRQTVALQLLTGHQLTAAKEYQEGIALLLADHYKSTEQDVEAVRTLDAGLQQFPRSQPLLYSRAMLYASLDEIAPAEADLAMVLLINPNHADALNSLGYILADKNLRLEEAKSYIDRALELTPNNAAAIDSLGWVLYRMGQHQQAIGHLQRALKLMPNDEIAAHLGEVLWVSGQQEEAIRVWKDGLKLNPESRYIHERLQRFELLSSAKAQASGEPQASPEIQ